MKKEKTCLHSMIKGYRFMSTINSELSEEAANCGVEALSACENLLSESEGLDSKKRGYILRRS